MNKRGAKRRAGERQQSPKLQLIPQVTTYRGPHFLPSRLRTTLRFNAHLTLNNAAQVYANIRYEPTYAYDIDPTLGSTAMPGFSELASLYRQYRVNSIKWKSSFSNLETFPLICYVCPLNGDPAANASNYQNLLSNRESRKRTAGPLTGNGVVTLTGETNVASFAGMANVLVDDATAANTSGTAPAQNIWLAVGIVGSSALVNGCFVETDLDIELDFFELSTPAS